MGLLPNPVLPSHYAPPSGGRPAKAQKLNEIPAKASKAALKKQRKEELLKNTKNAHKYIINGPGKWLPYHEHGYNEKGGDCRPKFF